MSRYRVLVTTRIKEPDEEGLKQKYMYVDALNVEDAQEIAREMLAGQTAWIEDTACLWEGDEEPMDRQLRRLGAPLLPGLE